MIPFGKFKFSFKTFSNCKSKGWISSSLSMTCLDGYILLAIAYGFKCQISLAEKPLHMFVGVSAFLKTRDNHCAKSSLLTFLFINQCLDIFIRL